jgi:hypothetical protein
MSLDADVVSFGIIANWFYTQKIVDPNGGIPKLCTLARAWILAERFLIPKLQNQIMNGVYFRFRNIEIPGVCKDFETFAKIVFTHGDGTNQLVEAGVWFLSWCPEDFIDSMSDEFPQAMLKQALRLAKNGSSVSSMNGELPRKFYLREKPEAGK